MDSQSSFRRIRGHGRAPLAVGLVLAAAMVTASAAPAQSAGVKPPAVKLEVEKYTLPNGLEVILREDHRLPLVAVNTWYHVGPANETAGRTGFAHLFEHMMFQSSGHVGGCDREPEWGDGRPQRRRRGRRGRRLRRRPVPGDDDHDLGEELPHRPQPSSTDTACGFANR